MSITITVSGSAAASYAPEEAHVSFVVTSQGADRAAVAAQVAEVHARVSAELSELSDDGKISTWSSGTASTYSYREQRPDGRPGELIHVTSINVEGVFVDLSALSPVVDGWLREPAISLGGIDWRLAKAHLVQRAAEVRADAVRDAVTKAQAYADALGAGTVAPVEIADAGMLPGNQNPGMPRPMLAARSFSAAGAEAAGVELRPRDIDVEVSVDARFTAST